LPSAPSERAPAVGQLLAGPRGQYRVGAERGRGGFGVTHVGTREADGAPVIIKFLPLAGGAADSAGARWKAVELFEREAAALRALAHPGVPRWIDDLPMGDPAAPHGFALVMEQIPGPTLRERMRTGGLSPGEMLAWLGDILAVLDFIHRRAPPLVHRDVNPKNIILRPGGPAALVDFGSVQAALRAPGGIAVTSAGTFGYAPMEQFLGQASPRSDLYGLGMTFAAAAAGREPEALPLEGIKVAVGGVLGPAFDRRVVRLIEAMVEPDPRARVASAAEAMALLRAASSAETTKAVAAPAITQVTPAAVAPAPPAKAARADDELWLEQVGRRLAQQGFTVTEGTQVGRTPLAFHAGRDARFSREGMHVYAAAVGAVEGAGDDGALSPVAAALFVQAAADAYLAPAGWRRLLGRRPVVVPLIAGLQDVGPRLAAHVATSLREPTDVIVVPLLVIAGATPKLEVVRPRSLLEGDPDDVVAQVRNTIPLYPWPRARS
jgi:hypothetical protein